MCKTELFNEVLEIVSRETEIPANKIISHDRSAEVVDARYILAYILYRRGIYISTIAEMMGYSRRAIEKIISQFDDRRNRLGGFFELIYKRSANKVRFANESTHLYSGA